MEALNRIFKNTLLFLVVFLSINYLMQGCQDKEAELLESSGNLLFTTTDNEYSRRQIVTVNLQNNTNDTIVIENECPNEPFNVYRKENNKWTERSSSPELDCSESDDLILEPGQKTKIMYDNWNNALFSEMGIFKIDFTTKINEEIQTFSTNEFLVVEEGIFRKLAIGLFYRPIYNGLMFFTSVTPGYNLGIAIIILTLIIRTLLLIPSQKAMKAQRRMQEVQPRLEKIKEKYKGDQQKIAAETMAIWKEAKVNPFGSCLPILLQFPFLIALFYVIQSGINPDNTYLLYSQYGDLSLQNINVNFLGVLDLTKRNFYVLPLIIGGLQFFQMQLAMAKKPKNKGKKSNEMAMATNVMTYVMPVMIAVFTASLPAGVGIYWGTSTFYGIVQQVFVNKGPLKDSKEPKVRVIKNN